MNRKFTIVALVLPFIAVIGLMLFYAFRPPDKISSVPGEVVEIELMPDFPRKWEAEGGNAPIRSLVTDADRIFFISDALHAIDGSSGKKLWDASINASTPLAVGEGLIAYGDADGTLYVLDASNGSEKWHARMGNSKATPRITDGIIFYADNGGVLHALAAGDGNEIWHLAFPGTATQIAADEKAVAVVSLNAASKRATMLVAESFSGKVQWTEEIFGEYPSVDVRSGTVLLQSVATNVQPRSTLLVARTPDSNGSVWQMTATNFALRTVFDDTTVYLGSMGPDGAKLIAVDMNTGSEKWNYSPDKTASAPQPFAVTDGLIYFTSGSDIDAADVSTGELKWRVKSRGQFMATPLIADASLCFSETRQAKIVALDLPSR